MNKEIKGLGGLPQVNMFESIPDFTKIVHERENKSENEQHLNDNRQKFTGQCAIVLTLLSKGIVLSSYSAMTQYHIGHLARRIKDIKDSDDYRKGKLPVIEDQFQVEKDGSKTRNKLWFIREALSESTAVKYKIDWKK